MTVEVVGPEDLEADESTPGIVRRPVFHTDETVMAHSSIEAGTETGWHHHCDRDAYGYVLEGAGVIEFEDDGLERLEFAAPAFFHVPAGTVHRETITADRVAKVVVNFVGSGPVVENVEGPTGE